MFGFSRDFFVNWILYRCPASRCWPILPKMFKPDGTKYPCYVGPALMDRNTVAECPKCGKRWPVFANAAVQPEALPATDYQYAILETHRDEEGFGDETRMIDNSMSPVELTRRFTIGREWSREYTIERANASRFTQEFGLKGHEFASLALGAEQELSQRYSLTETSKESYSEEISVAVPAKTKLKLVFHWKRIWQIGSISVTQNGANVCDIPFKVAVGVTFDQSQSEG